MLVFVKSDVGDEDTELGQPFSLEDVFKLTPRKFVAQWLPGILQH